MQTFVRLNAFLFFWFFSYHAFKHPFFLFFCLFHVCFLVPTFSFRFLISLLCYNSRHTPLSSIACLILSFLSNYYLSFSLLSPSLLCPESFMGDGRSYRSPLCLHCGRHRRTVSPGGRESRCLLHRCSVCVCVCVHGCGIFIWLGMVVC